MVDGSSFCGIAHDATMDDRKIDISPILNNPEGTTIGSRGRAHRGMFFSLSSAGELLRFAPFYNSLLFPPRFNLG